MMPAGPLKVVTKPIFTLSSACAGSARRIAAAAAAAARCFFIVPPLDRRVLLSVIEPSL
jgi:hypothetical protein